MPCYWHSRFGYRTALLHARRLAAGRATGKNMGGGRTRVHAIERSASFGTGACGRADGCIATAGGDSLAPPWEPLLLQRHLLSLAGVNEPNERRSICWFEGYITDSLPEKLLPLACTGFLHGFPARTTTRVPIVRTSSVAATHGWRSRLTIHTCTLQRSGGAATRSAADPCVGQRTAIPVYDHARNQCTRMLTHSRVNPRLISLRRN